MDDSPAISSSLLLTSLNFHGQELLTALQIEHGDKVVKKYVDTRCLNYVEYHKRAPQAELHLRSKRQRLLQFIAKKADMLFKPISPVTNSVEENEEKYAILPPIEKYMLVPPAERRSRFFDTVQRGDILIGIVRSKSHPSLGSTSRGNYIVNLLCFDRKRKRYIDDLLIKAEIARGEYNFNDVVRGYVYNHSPSTSKIIIATHIAADYPGYPRNINLGKIGPEELPKHYLLSTEELNYETVLESIPSFNNPNAVENLCIEFGLPIASCYTSFMKNLSIDKFDRSEFATELKKRQMSHWAMRGYREGEKFSKDDELPKTIESANTALDIDPQNAEAFVARGALYVSSENFEKAIEDFKMALNCESENRHAKKYLSEAYMMLGQKHAGLGDINLSYENFKFAVEYNPSNKEAVDYLTAIMSVKSLEEADNPADENSAEDEKPTVKSPKELIPTSNGTATDNFVPHATDSLPYTAGWQGSYLPAWSATSSAYDHGPSVSWQNPASTWTPQSSIWHGTSSVWPGMSPSTCTQPQYGTYPVVAPAPMGIPSLPQAAASNAHTPKPPELPPNVPTEAIPVSFEEQLKHMIEEERDRHVLKRSRSHSLSPTSSSSSLSAKRKRHSSHRKKRRYKDESDNDDSSRSSVSSAIDEHKLKCEEFLERNRRQMEKNQSQSRDTKGVPVKKDVKEDSSSKKEHHKNVHKKDCLKKLSRTCSKEHKDSSAKKEKQESVSEKKEQKIDSSVKKDCRKNEKPTVELSHVNENYSDQEPDGQLYEDRKISDEKSTQIDVKENGSTPMKDAQKKKVVPAKKKEEKLPAKSTSKQQEPSTSSSNQKFTLVYVKCAFKQGVEQIVECRDDAASPAPADVNVTTVDADDQSTVVASGHLETSQDKKVLTKSHEPNNKIPSKKKAVPALPQTTSSRVTERLFSDVSSDSSTALSEFRSQDRKLDSRRKRRHHTHERKSSHSHRRHKRRSNDSAHEHLDNYPVADYSASGGRTSNYYLISRIIKENRRIKGGDMNSSEAGALFLGNLGSVASKYLDSIIERSLRKISELL